MRALVLPLMLLAGACASTPQASAPMQAAPAPAQTRLPPPTPDSLDVIARGYVKLILDIGQLEPGYVDAYYGPAEWQTEADAETETAAQLLRRADHLAQRLAGFDRTGGAPPGDPAQVQRRAYLAAHVDAARARLRMIGGERMSFADEAEALFGIRPEIRPLSDYDTVLAEIDALLSGSGSLTDRVTEFRSHYVIPRDRLRPVLDAAIAECRRRTLEHIALPADETFTLELVGDKPWSGYNYYQGNSVSKIEINADLPIYTERAIDLGCHEGYPGHHVYNALLERTFVRERGWVEMSVYPLYSPMSFIAEGSANYGIDLAFPGDEGVRFERDVLYPLAGLDPAIAGREEQLMSLMRRLQRAEYTIADAYLGGRIDREEAIGQIMRYTLSARERATQRVRFIDTYRSYIINYGLGRDTVQAWVERQGPDHWATTERLLASQILPVDLLP